MPSHPRITPTDSQPSEQAPVLKIKTHLKAGGGGLSTNHNETLAGATGRAKSLKVKTHLKAGGTPLNHNETLVEAPRPAAALRVKTPLKAEA